jgi:hypothetical protein
MLLREVAKQVLWDDRVGCVIIKCLFNQEVIGNMAKLPPSSGGMDGKDNIVLDGLR